MAPPSCPRTRTNLVTGLAGVRMNAAGFSVRTGEAASLVQGAKVVLAAGNDINIISGVVVADQQLTASAGRGLNRVPTAVCIADTIRQPLVLSP